MPDSTTLHVVRTDGGAYYFAGHCADVEIITPDPLPLPEAVAFAALIHDTMLSFTTRAEIFALRVTADDPVISTLTLGGVLPPLDVLSLVGHFDLILDDEPAAPAPDVETLAAKVRRAGGVL